MQAVFPTQVHYEVQLPVTIEVTRPWNVEVWFIDEPVGRIEHLRFATMGRTTVASREIRTRTHEGPAGIVAHVGAEGTAPAPMRRPQQTQYSVVKDHRRFSLKAPASGRRSRALDFTLLISPAIRR